MKTILFAFYTFGIVIAAASLGARELNFGAVTAGLAVAVMFAMALNDSPRALRPLPRPAMAGHHDRPVRPLDLAA